MLEKIKNNKSTVIVSAILVVAIAIIIGMTFFNKDVVASVDGEKITKDELYTVLAGQYGSRVVDSLITNKVIELEAKKQNVTVSDDEIQEELEAFIESFGGEEYFNSSLESSGISLSDFKYDIKIFLLTKKLMEPTIEITEDELKEYFETNKESFDQAEQVKASHILVEDEETAKEVKKKLDEGGDFEELSNEYSTDEVAKAEGGDLGWIESGDANWDADFLEGAFALEKDQISEPVKSQFGYHIIKVTDKKEAKEATYEDVKDTVKEALLEEKISANYPTWLTELKKEYDIKNTFE